MATAYKSRVEYTVTDGARVTYPFPFSYLRKQFIKVSIRHANATETPLTYNVDYNINDLSLTLKKPISAGEILIIYRETSTDKIVTWNDGSILLARDMNLEDAQLLHLQEEQQDYIKAHSINTSVTATNEVFWDANKHRVSNVLDPKDAQDVVTKHYMENVQGGFVLANTNLVDEATRQASAAKASQEKAHTSENNALSSAQTAGGFSELSQKWAESTLSPDGRVDQQSPDGQTRSSRSWALYGKEKAQGALDSAYNAKNSEENAKSSETKAGISETNAKASETRARTSESNAASSERNAKSSETNAKASEINARNSANASQASAEASASSARQAAESAGVFQDFKGATSSSDGMGGKVPKPKAGQNGKYLKGDGTWSDVPALTPSTMWSAMHSYGVNYVPSDVSNQGWNRLGFCSLYYTQNKLKNQPSQYGQLLNIPADDGAESMQLWIGQSNGPLWYRGGNGASDGRMNDKSFTEVATKGDVNDARNRANNAQNSANSANSNANSREKVNSQGGNWIRYESGLQLCWTANSIKQGSWTYPIAFASVPAIILGGEWTQTTKANPSFKDRTNTSVFVTGLTNVTAIGRWK
ncbi:phage tail fiber protein [Megasphaera massiliensis]|uniref:phage tail fiber domain-containing protein n=1 Tax=Megasphaera massiliensis TaxID=1232428 RepID=UPI00307A9467